MMSFSASGDWRRTEKFLDAMKKQDFWKILNRYGQMGVDALSAATPTDSGKTADSWSYKVYEKSKNQTSTIVWYNDNNEGGSNVAVLIQYGHGTKNGGYVQGKDYINPAMRPIFDRIANDLWAEIKRL